MPAGAEAKLSTRCCGTVGPEGKLRSSEVGTSGPLPWFFFNAFRYIVKKNFFNLYGCKELCGQLKAGVTDLTTNDLLKLPLDSFPSLTTQ